MKNWETEKFADEFYDAMDCTKCPAYKKYKISGTHVFRKEDCIRSFIDYAMKEYKPAIKKMTMQEWANVTGLPVAKDRHGMVYIYSSMKIKKDGDVWKSDVSSCLNITGRVTDAEEHDWNVPCYPA
jgi:hypothetical protein